MVSSFALSFSVFVFANNFFFLNHSTCIYTSGWDSGGPVILAGDDYHSDLVVGLVRAFVIARYSTVVFVWKKRSIILIG